MAYNLATERGKEADVVIEKNIGEIFRRVNVVEYKSPSDTLNAAGYNKAMAYAHLYMSLEKVHHSDMTVTLISYRRPREFIRYLKGMDCAIEQRHAGILYVTGKIIPFPMQVIISRELDEDDNLWLKNLSNEVSVESTIKLAESAAKVRDKSNIAAYMYLFARVNKTIMMEAKKMARKRLPTIEEVFEDLGWTAEWEARGETRARIEMAIAYVNDGDSVEHAAKMARITVEELEAILSAEALEDDNAGE
jgi:hypothetical protein